MSRYARSTAPSLAALLLLGACGPERESLESATLAEAWVRVQEPSDLALLRAAPLSFGESRQGARVKVIGDRASLQGLMERGLEVEILREDHRQLPPSTKEYHDPEQARARLRELAERCKVPARLRSLGESLRGRPIEGLLLGEGQGRIRLVGAHHGNEAISAELALETARWACDGGLPEDVELMVIPQLNPDGIAEGSRYNARGVDLNRNYSHMWTEREFMAGEAPFSEPETRALQATSLYEPPGLGLSLHSGARNIGYPWNYTETDSPDEALLVELASEYASSLNDFEVLNGADWYITRGDLNDWSYAMQGTLDLTAELSDEGTPLGDAREAILLEQQEPILELLASAPLMKGRVVDARDGAPIEASIFPEDAMPSLCAPDGGFARWLSPGARGVEVRAPGYRGRILKAPLQVGVSQDMDVALEPQDDLLLEFDPVLLPWSDTEVALDLDAGDARVLGLWRPGFDDVAVFADEGRFQVVSSGLAPGPWGLSLMGRVAPRALFVGERNDRVELGAVKIEGEKVRIQGKGFGLGSRAWSIEPPMRNLRELQVLGEEAEELLVELPDRGETTDGVIDLLLLSNGAQLVVLDLFQDRAFDTASPSDTGWVEPTLDTGPGLAPGQGACGCVSAPVRPRPLALPLLLFLICARGRWRGTGYLGGRPREWQANLSTPSARAKEGVPDHESDNRT